MTIRYQYRDNGRRAVLAQICLAAGLVLTVYFSAMPLLAASQTPSNGRMNTLETIVLVLYWLIQLFTRITFLFWFRRAYENAAANGMRLRYALGWSVGAWFVPIVNYWWPARMANDMWRHAVARTRMRTLNLVVPWWCSWVLHSVMPFQTFLYVFLVARSARKLPEFESANLFSLVLTANDVIGALLAIEMIRRLTRMQAQASLESIASVFGGEGTATEVPPVTATGMRREPRSRSTG